MADETVTQNEPHACDVLNFPENARILSYEEVLGLVPYKRQSTPAFGLEYVTVFHLRILLAYATQYIGNVKEFQKPSDAALRGLEYIAGEAIQRIKQKIDYLTEHEASDGVIAAMWHEAVDNFRWLHTWKDNPEWPEVASSLELWKQGRLGE